MEEDFHSRERLVDRDACVSNLFKLLFRFIFSFLPKRTRHSVHVIDCEQAARVVEFSFNNRVTRNCCLCNDISGNTQFLFENFRNYNLTERVINLHDFYSRLILGVHLISLLFGKFVRFFLNFHIFYVKISYARRKQLTDTTRLRLVYFILLRISIQILEMLKFFGKATVKFVSIILEIQKRTIKNNLRLLRN